jgi:hypothetical protein
MNVYKNTLCIALTGSIILGNAFESMTNKMINSLIPKSLISSTFVDFAANSSKQTPPTAHFLISANSSKQTPPNIQTFIPLHPTADAFFNMS